MILYGIEHITITMSSEAPPPFTERMLGMLEPAKLMTWAMSRKYRRRTDAEDINVEIAYNSSTLRSFLQIPFCLADLVSLL